MNVPIPGHPLQPARRLSRAHLAVAGVLVAAVIAALALGLLTQRRRLDLAGYVPADLFAYVQLADPVAGRPGPKLAQIVGQPLVSGWSAQLPHDLNPIVWGTHPAVRQLAYVWTSATSTPRLLVELRGGPHAPLPVATGRPLHPRVLAYGGDAAAASSGRTLRDALGNRLTTDTTASVYLRDLTQVGPWSSRLAAALSLDTKIIQSLIPQLAAASGIAVVATLDWRPGFWQADVRPVEVPAGSGGDGLPVRVPILLHDEATARLLVRGVTVAAAATLAGSLLEPWPYASDYLLEALPRLTAGPADLSVQPNTASGTPAFVLGLPRRADDDSAAIETAMAQLAARLQPARVPQPWPDGGSGVQLRAAADTRRWQAGSQPWPVRIWSAGAVRLAYALTPQALLVGTDVAAVQRQRDSLVGATPLPHPCTRSASPAVLFDGDWLAATLGWPRVEQVGWRGAVTGTAKGGLRFCFW